MDKHVGQELSWTDISMKSLDRMTEHSCSFLAIILIDRHLFDFFGKSLSSMSHAFLFIYIVFRVLLQVQTEIYHTTTYWINDILRDLHWSSFYVGSKTAHLYLHKFPIFCRALLFYYLCLCYKMLCVSKTYIVQPLKYVADMCVMCYWYVIT